MAEAISSFTKKRYAVVTGSNKGIGFEICKQLASNGVTVVVTARDEKKGAEAIEKLNNSGLSEYLVFHQLDVTKPSSVASLADFVRAQFGGLDILVNNAGILDAPPDWEAVPAFVTDGIYKAQSNTVSELEMTVKHTNGTPEECLETNYYGAKRMVEALIPLLQLSDSPRIVNVSSMAGLLKNISSKKVKGVLDNVESLDEETVDKVLSEFLKDVKEGSLETRGWPTFVPVYSMSKAAMNAYTRVLAKRYPSFRINCVCPGYTKTDMTGNRGFKTAEEGAEGPVKLALLPNDAPSGLFFQGNEVSSF